MDEQVIETATGLGYVELMEGTGARPKTGDTVSVHYTGWLKSGQKFDSSVDRGEPLTFPIGKGRVIKGWDEGVGTMKVGESAGSSSPPIWATASGERAASFRRAPPSSSRSSCWACSRPRPRPTSYPGVGTTGRH